jgi:hypothetical protein
MIYPISESLWLRISGLFDDFFLQERIGMRGKSYACRNESMGIYHTMFSEKSKNVFPKKQSGGQSWNEGAITVLVLSVTLGIVDQERSFTEFLCKMAFHQCIESHVHLDCVMGN